MARNSIEIRVWMQRHQVRQVDIQKNLGHTNNKTVWATIEGHEDNRRVLSWLLDRGCPASLLALPEDMQVVA